MSTGRSTSRSRKAYNTAVVPQPVVTNVKHTRYLVQCANQCQTMVALVRLVPGLGLVLFVSCTGCVNYFQENNLVSTPRSSCETTEVCRQSTVNSRQSVDRALLGHGQGATRQSETSVDSRQSVERGRRRCGCTAARQRVSTTKNKRAEGGGRAEWGCR